MARQPEGAGGLGVGVNPEPGIKLAQQKQQKQERGDPTEEEDGAETLRGVCGGGGVCRPRGGGGSRQVDKWVFGAVAVLDLGWCNGDNLGACTHFNTTFST